MLQTDTVILNKYNEHGVVVSGGVKVPKDKVMSSRLFNNIIVDCNHHVDELPFPHQFNDVFDAYLCPILSCNNLSKCLELAHYLEDNNFLQEVIKILVDTWVCSDEDNGLLSPTIDHLVFDLQCDIYLHCPYYFLPDWYVLNNKLFNNWLVLNKGKKFCVARGYEYYCSITLMYKDSLSLKMKDSLNCKIMDITPYYKDPLNSSLLMHGVYRHWDADGSKLIAHKSYRYDKKYGVCKSWNAVTGQLQTEVYYQNDNKHGTVKYYDRNSLVLNHHYTDGVKDGWQTGYYGPNCVKYFCLYTAGTRIQAHEYNPNGKVIREGKYVIEYNESSYGI